MSSDRKKDKTQLAVIVTIIMVCVVCLWFFVLFPESKKRIEKEAPPTVGEAVREITKPSEEEQAEEEAVEVKRRVEEERVKETEEMKNVPRFPLSSDKVVVEEESGNNFK